MLKNIEEIILPQKDFFITLMSMLYNVTEEII